MDLIPCVKSAQKFYVVSLTQIFPHVFEKVWNATVTSLHDSKQCKQPQ